MMRVAVCLAAIGLMASGCAWFSREPSQNYNNPDSIIIRGTNSAGGMILTPETSPIGRVVSVHEGGRFVVLNYPVGTLPLKGQRLYVYRQGLKVGELKVSGPQMDDNTAADIVNGEVQLGDEIRSK